METIRALATEYSPLLWNVAQAFAFLVIGWFVANRVSAYIRRVVLAKKTLDDTLGTFFAQIAKYVILIVTLIAVLQLFGFQATSLVAILGAAGLAIGLALQGTLSNVAAGVMLIIFRPYRYDDFVEISGHSGTVKGISLFSTELATPDNIKVVIPNSSAWGSAVINYSAHDTRRLDITIGISYDDDPDQALKLMADAVSADTRTLKDPEPFFAVTALGDSAVDVTMRVWCKASDYWPMKFDMLKKLKADFDAAGVSIPYPHMEIVQKK